MAESPQSWLWSSGIDPTCVREKLLWLAGEEMYVAMDKGAISKTHVLLLPIDHTSSTLELRPAQYAELDRFLDALRDYFKSQVIASWVIVSIACMTRHSNLVAACNRCMQAVGPKLPWPALSPM